MMVGNRVLFTNGVQDLRTDEKMEVVNESR